MLNLHDFKKNIYSQFGEDGILTELIRRLPQEVLNQTAVEFGAWMVFTSRISQIWLKIIILGRVL